jgi:hypothetical protein
MDHQAFAELLGNYGEFVGAIAVVVTLAFLSIQLRQNTSALKSSTWQAIQNAEHVYDQSLVSNESAAQLWVNGAANGLDSLDDPAERFRCLLIGKQLVDQFQNHHYHYEQGLIDSELWQTWISQFEEEIANSPGFVDVLKERYSHLRPTFQRFVDQYGLNLQK